MNPRRIVLVAAIFLAGLTACNSASQTTNTSQKERDVQVAESEEEFQSDVDIDNEIRAEVRQSTADFVKAKLPNWTLKGVSSELYQFQVYWVAADIEKDGRSVVLDLVVRKFFPEAGGNPYWKVVSLRKTLEQQLHDMNDADVWKQLNEAKNPPDTQEP